MFHRMYRHHFCQRAAGEPMMAFGYLVFFIKFNRGTIFHLQITYVCWYDIFLDIYLTPLTENAIRCIDKHILYIYSYSKYIGKSNVMRKKCKLSNLIILYSSVSPSNHQLNDMM